jgi:hypothetical protein
MQGLWQGHSPSSSRSLGGKTREEQQIALTTPRAAAVAIAALFRTVEKLY